MSAKGAKEVRNRREQQLRAAEAQLVATKKELHENARTAGQAGVLHSHLEGFYEEVDKLTKGKAMLEVTNLIVEGANTIIADAKGLIKADPYLMRVVEFVPAGNNPVYPDVLVTMRTVQQAVERFRKGVKAEQDSLLTARHRTETAVQALMLYLEEGNEAPSREELEAALDGRSPDMYYFSSDESYHRLFDFGKLDRFGLDPQDGEGEDVPEEEEEEEE